MKNSKNLNFLAFNNNLKTLRAFKVLIAIFAITFSSNLYSQNPGMNAVNAQLRALFSPLTPPSPPKLFLYEMSAKASDPVYWNTICYSTITADDWYKIYEEMYHSAYDTLPLLSPDSIYPRHFRVNRDIIPIYIMNYDYNHFVDDYLNESNYFNFNTENSTMTDGEDWEKGYTFNSIFTASPLDIEYNFSNPTFRIDPAIIYTDPDNSFHFQNTSDAILKIDFGDGNGYVQIDPTSVYDHQVTYSTDGVKTIKTAIFGKEENLICYSQSKITIRSPYVKPVPAQTFDYPGINAALYSPCGSSSTMNGKVVIYLEGLDPLDMDGNGPISTYVMTEKSRHAEDIYSQMINNNKIVELRNFGYSFLVVDWKKSTIDIRFNALYLVNLLEELKCDLDDNSQQFVIMGESMGGLVARFALTYMESPAYLINDISPFFIDSWDVGSLYYIEQHPEILTINNDWKECQKDKLHNTRLLITLDTPHQGANIPVSLQHLYRDIEGLATLLPIASFATAALPFYLKAQNVLLDSKAAKEMLIHYARTIPGPFYLPADDKAIFFNQLLLMGNYPHLCKVVAMSNGSIAGISQNNESVNEIILGFNKHKTITVLGNDIPIFDCDARFRTNPNGVGEIIHASIGTYLNIPTISFSWSSPHFHIGFNSTFIPLLPDYRVDAIGVKPICTKQGGYQTLANDYLNFGSNGLYTEGPQFCFIPTQSALDLGDINIGFPALNENLESHGTTWNLTLAHPDVLIGVPSSDRGENYNHLELRNPTIYNLSQQILPNPITREDTLYYHCDSNEEVNPVRGLLNLEIGDEELYLENATLPYFSAYQSEYDIHVNERNNYYNYPSISNVAAGLLLDGCYSKEQPFFITPTGTANFYFDSNSPTGIGLSYSAPTSGSYFSNDQANSVCCHSFIGERIKNDEPKNVNLVDNRFLSVRPNPSNGNDILVRTSSLLSSSAELSIIDIYGKIVYSKYLSEEEINYGEFKINLSSLNLVSSLYFLKFQDAYKSQVAKLILNK